jgi:glycerol-3-phosphate acyltransferase PlsY
MFPLWLGFRGGKGVATAAGTIVVIAWPVALIASGLWLAVASVTRYASLAALIAAVAAAATAPFLTDAAAAGVVTVIALLVILRHQANIRRLIAGREHRISLRKG